MKKNLILIFIALFASICNKTYSQLSCYHFVIDAGHGGTDPGSYCSNGVAEKVLTLDMSSDLKNNLQGKGASVSMTRQTDVYVSLAARRDFINNENPDAAISIHLNAYNAVVQGTETYWCAGTVSNTLANQVQPLLVSVIGYNDRGVKNTCFTVLTTNTSIPTILTESLFHDEPNGCTFINNQVNQSNIANAHAMGIQNFLPVCNTVINNDCDNAIQLNSNLNCNYTMGTLSGATSSSLVKASCDVFGSPAKKDVFYYFYASETEHTVEVNPTGTGADAVDAVVSVYAGANCNTLSEVACGGGSGGGGGNTKTINLNNLNVGHRYWVRLYDYGTIDPLYPEFDICITHNVSTAIDVNTNDRSTKIYPIPAFDILNIESDIKYHQINIKNSIGQNLISFIPVEPIHKIDISMLNSGFYFIEFVSSDAKIIKKLIVNN